MNSCETMSSPMKINQTEVNNMEGLLQYIEQVDQSVADAEVNVLESLIQSYDKAITIIQESDDNTDLSAFDIFQEGEKWDKFKKDTEAPVFGNKGESLIKRILMIIPRLIQKIIALIRKLVSKNKTFEKKMDNDVKELKQQAERVVPEELTDEQAKSIAEKLNETKNETKAEKPNEIKVDVDDSLDTKREKINKMMDSMKNDETLKFKSDGSIGLSKITPDVVKNIDKKNPGLVDELLDEIGAPPRKKVKHEDIKIEIQHTTFFGVGFLSDNQMENSQSGAMTIYTDPLVNGFEELKSNRYSTKAKRDYAEDLEGIYHNWLDTVEYIMNDRFTGKTVYVTFGNAVHVFEQMKKIFEDDVKASKKSCDDINKLIKEIESEYKTFNDTVIPGQGGETQLSLLRYLKDVITVLANLVEISTSCLEGWQMIWDVNYSAIQDALKDDSFQKDSHPTLHLPFNPVTYGTGKWHDKFISDYNRWRHVPMPIA